MMIRRGNGKERKDSSLGVLHGEAASSSVESAGCSYQSVSVHAAGADAQGLALLSVVTNLVLSMVLIKVPSLVEGSKRSLKRSTIILAIVSSITWLPLIFVTLFYKGVSPFLLIGLWTMGLVPTVLLYPLRDNWLASLVPGDKMGRYLGVRSVIAGCFFLATFNLMGVILQRTTGDKSTSLAFVLALAFLGSAVTLVLYCAIRPPKVPDVKSKEPPLTFVNFLKNTRKTHLGTFIVFVSMFTFAVNLSGPLFASYMLDDLKFSYMTLSAMVSFEYVARIISLTIWGRQVDKVGSLRVMSVVAYFIPFIPILWLFSRSLPYLAVVQVLSGTMWAAFDLSVQTFIYKATPPHQRLRYIVFHRSLTSLCVALGSLTGALLLNNMFRIFGSQILGLFLVSGVLRMVIARVMLPKLSPQGIPGAVVHTELAGELATALAPERMGIYYYPETWRRFTRKAAAVGGSILGRAVGKIAPARSGLFYKTAQWADYLSRAGAQPLAVEASTQPAHEGLYYQRDAWAQEHGQPDAAKTGERQPRDRSGLFHNPERWGEYLQRAMVLGAATMTTGGEGVVLRQAVFHHPELWDKYQNSTAAKKASSAPASRQGLLYQPEEWQKYQERTAVRKHGQRHLPAGAPSVQGLLYQPDEWQKYQERTAVRKHGQRHLPAGASASASRVLKYQRNDSPAHLTARPVNRRPAHARVVDSRHTRVSPAAVLTTPRMMHAGARAASSN